MATTTFTLDEVRQRENHFYMDTPNISVPMDERAAIQAMNDPRAVDMDTLRRIHTQSEESKRQHNTQRWEDMAQALPQITPQYNPQLNSTPPIQPEHVFTSPKSANKLMQTYADIVTDLRNFKSLPQKTNLAKVEACFFKDNRVYVTVTTTAILILVLVVIVVFCFSSSKR